MQAGVDLVSFEVVDSFLNFDRIAGRVAENLIHVGEDRFGFGPGGIGNADNRARQFVAVFQTVHKCAVAAFEVHDQTV